MNIFQVSVPLQTSPEQAARLQDLQRAFAQACNFLAPLVREHRCWNRVALHHLGYRPLRNAMPTLGSQMACNAIYSVCRSARLVFQHPQSPFYIQRWGNRPLPLLRFTESCPVYLDRHTLSLRNGQISMFTLDGRLRFDIDLTHTHEAAFYSMRLQEILLTQTQPSVYQLIFILKQSEQKSVTQPSYATNKQLIWPEYLMIEAST